MRRSPTQFAIVNTDDLSRVHPKFIRYLGYESAASIVQELKEKNGIQFSSWQGDILYVRVEGVLTRRYRSEEGLTTA